MFISSGFVIWMTIGSTSPKISQQPVESIIQGSFQIDFILFSNFKK